LLQKFLGVKFLGIKFLGN